MATDKDFTDAFEEAVRKHMAKEKVGNEQKTVETPTEAASNRTTSNYTIIQYSEKSVAIFGDTRAIKRELATLGGRFNMYLVLNGRKCAGWIFQKSKEEDLRRLVNLN